jgi:hypothetical protein
MLRCLPNQISVTRSSLGGLSGAPLWSGLAAGQTLTLPLLVARILADHMQDSTTPNNTAVSAKSLYGCLNFHCHYNLCRRAVPNTRGPSWRAGALWNATPRFLSGKGLTFRACRAKTEDRGIPVFRKDKDYNIGVGKPPSRTNWKNAGGT